MSPARRRSPGWRLAGLAGAAALVIACVAVVVALAHGPARPRPAAHPRPQPQLRRPQPQAGVPPVRICGSKSILTGPSVPPAGAVTVGAGDDARVNWGRPDVTYWLAPGLHTLGPGRYTQIMPGRGATFTGAPGAVIDGEHQNYYAFGGTAQDVTISYLTIQDFGTNGGNMNQGVVNHNSATGWLVDHSTITGNAGAGVMLGSHDTLSYDCLSDNQQYGLNAYSSAGPSDVTVDHNEIAGNDTYNWERHVPGCGCSGGGKFWAVAGAVITDNWVYDNHSVGLWADTNNRGFDIAGNYFEDNYDVGLQYEISYNALIRDNVFVRNGLGQGPRNSGFPDGAIYISESGSSRRVPGPYNISFLITGNRFVDNWSGVILWENSNRFCGSPANSSTGSCTLVDPAVANIHTCDKAHLAGARPSRMDGYFNLCRWMTQNVMVERNTFDFNPRAIGPLCTPANGCGIQGIFSEYGSYPSWSPYQGTIVERHITFDQDNHFGHNTYNGPWQFMAFQLGDFVSWSSWRGHYHQDVTSTLNQSAS